MPITKWGSQSEKALGLSDSNYTALWERQNYGDSKKTSGFQGISGEGEMNGQSTGDF